MTTARYRSGDIVKDQFGNLNLVLGPSPISNGSDDLYSVRWQGTEPGQDDVFLHPPTELIKRFGAGHIPEALTAMIEMEGIGGQCCPPCRAVSP